MNQVNITMANKAPKSVSDAPETPTTSTVIPPRVVRFTSSIDDELECSLHFLPKPLMREFSHVFNDSYLRFHDDSDMGVDGNNSSELRLLAIPTNQRAREDLVAVGDHIEAEKDRLLNVVSYASFVVTAPERSCHINCTHINNYHLNIMLSVYGVW